MHMRIRPPETCTSPGLGSLANPNILPPKQQPTTVLELAVELGNPARLTKLIALLWPMRARTTTLKWLGYSTLAKHHTQEFGLLQQLPSIYQLPWHAFSVFSVQRRMASARSFNMFQSMLHMGLIG